MKIKDIPSLERPRERALQIGLEHLSNEDLLAILLGSGTSSLSAKEVALHLLSKLQSLSSLQDESVESLSHIKGIGKVKALHLLASVELGKRVLMKNYNNHLRYTNPKDIFELNTNEYKIIGMPFFTNIDNTSDWIKCFKEEIN